MVASGVEVRDFSLPAVLFSKLQVLHLHWPDYQLGKRNVAEAAVRILSLFLILLLVKLKGVKIVWTVHNVFSHERYHPRLEKVFWRIFLTLIDGYIALSASGREIAQQRFPKLRQLPGAVIPHGHYKNVYPDEVSEATAREMLQLPREAKVFLLLGAVRPYKNVCHLIETFVRLDDPDCRLIIAGGCPEPMLRAEIAALSAGNKNITLKLSFVPDSDVQLYMKAANLVVLPFTDILNSGSALLALSFSKPVLVPSKGSMEELQGFVGSQWVHTYDGTLTERSLAEAMAAACHQAGATIDLQRLGWGMIAADTANFFTKVLLSHR